MQRSPTRHGFNWCWLPTRARAARQTPERLLVRAPLTRSAVMEQDSADHCLTASTYTCRSCPLLEQSWWTAAGESRALQSGSECLPLALERTRVLPVCRGHVMHKSLVLNSDARTACQPMR